MAEPGKPFKIMGRWFAYDENGDLVEVAEPAPQRNVTPAQIQAAVKAGAITRDQGAAQLAALGLDEAEIGIILGGRAAAPATGGGGRGRTRFPEEQAQDELRNKLLELQIANFGADTEMGRMKMAYQKERDAIDDEYRQTLFLFNKAKDERDFGEQQRQFGLLQKLRERASDLAEKQAEVQQRMGYAASARADMTANIGRAEALGYTVGDELGVAPGTLTASERARQYQQQVGVQDRQTAQANIERDRAERAGTEQFTRGVTIRNLENQEAAQEEAVKQARINTALNVVGRRGMPRIARTM